MKFLILDLLRKVKYPSLRSYNFGRLQSKKKIELIHILKKVLQSRCSIVTKKNSNINILVL